MRLLHARASWSRATAFLAKHPDPTLDQIKARPLRQPLPLRHLRPDLRGRAGRPPRRRGGRPWHRKSRKASRARRVKRSQAKAGLAGGAADDGGRRRRRATSSPGTRQLDAVRAGGQAAARASRRPLKVTGRAKYTYDVKLPGHALRPDDRRRGPGRRDRLDRHRRRPRRCPGVKAVWTADSKIVRFAGQDVAAVAAVSPEIAEDAARLVKVTYKERPFTHELREAMKAGRAARLRRRREPRAARTSPRKGNVVGPDERPARRRPRRRREGLRRGRGHASRRPTTARSTPTRRSRRTASWRPGRATSSPSTPRPRRSSPCARASPRRSRSTARTCACSASTWAAASAASSGRRRPAARSPSSPASSRRRPARRSS